MAEFALVGDIGGTNSRFGLVNPGSMAILHMEALRNDNFPSLEGAIQQYLRNREVIPSHLPPLPLPPRLTVSTFP